MIDYENGRAAQTDWRVMKSNDTESRLRLFPKTGRSHQLRVHTKFIGHPILGDPLYTPDTYQDYPRMMLHAEELRISHPDGGKGHTFRVKAPF
jgi:tRNA pseudouridine32 synthase/23S rRNA pseudouridine746 synthase